MFSASSAPCWAEFERENDVDEHALTGIMSVHSISLHPKGILSHNLSCNDCKQNGFCVRIVESEPLLKASTDKFAAEEEAPTCTFDV